MAILDLEPLGAIQYNRDYIGDQLDWKGGTIMAQNNTRKTSIWRQLGYIVLCLVIGAVIGLLIGRVFGPSLANQLRHVSITYLLATFIVSTILHIIIHEGGHLLGGLLTGYKFVSFRVMDLKLEKSESGGFKFRWQHVAGTGGQCLMRPPRYQSQKFPFRLYLAGGFLANILTSVLAYWLWPNIYVFVFASLGILMGLTNAIPMSFNDGKNLLLLSRSELNRLVLFIMLEDNYWANRGKSYDEKYRYLRRVTINETNFLTDATIFYDLEQLVDQGQFEEVYILAKKIYQEREDMVTPYRQEILRLLLFAASLQHPEDPLITTLLEDPLLVAMLKTKRPENSTAQAAYHWRVKGDVATALEHLAQAKKRLPRAHNLRAQEQEARIIDYLEEKIQAEQANND